MCPSAAPWPPPSRKLREDHKIPQMRYRESSLCTMARSPPTATLIAAGPHGRESAPGTVPRFAADRAGHLQPPLGGMAVHRIRRVVTTLVLSLALAVAGHAIGTEDRAGAAQRLHQAATLARAELALDALGYRIDPPDGLPDRLTSRALAWFRRDAGLPAELPVDDPLADVLEAAAALRATTHRALAAARRAAEERLVRADVSAEPAGAPLRPASGGGSGSGRWLGAGLLPD